MNRRDNRTGDTVTTARLVMGTAEKEKMPVTFILPFCQKELT
jgi:hypothetical protein